MKALWYIVFLLLLGMGPMHGSDGDRSEEFQDCLFACTSTNCDVDQWGDPVPPNNPYRMSRIHVNGFNRTNSPWTRWPWTLSSRACSKDCEYMCMEDIEAQKRQLSLKVVQYHGKWPFVRILGCQEILSVIFSLYNMVSHILGGHLIYSKFVKQGHQNYMAKYYLGYSVVSALFTWPFSAVFHAYDVDWTERLDYVTAIFSVIMGTYLALMRVFGNTLNRVCLAGLSSGTWLGLAFLAFALSHASSLFGERFDFGFNKKLLGGFGGLFLSTYLGWWLVGDGRARYYGNQVPIFVSYFVGAMLFELFLQIPPLGGLLDAHAIWHAATAPLTYYIYSFFLNDLFYELGLETLSGGLQPRVAHGPPHDTL